MALIEVRDLKKLYPMGGTLVRALDGVDLDIEQGEFIAITGASGSGKSTIMHLLGCLDRPTSGQYRFNGRDVSGLSDRQLADTRNRQIGFIFQTFNLINRISALDNVAVPLFYARKTNTRAQALKALERVGLAQRATHKSNELSGGERQRVAIARSIVNDPPLLLADEPTGNLDSRTGQQIIEVFRALNEQGVTIVLVTHEYDVAIHARRIVQMRDGKIVSDMLTKDLQGRKNEHSLQTRSFATLENLQQQETGGTTTATSAHTQQPADVPKEEFGPARTGRGVTATLTLGILAFTSLLAAIVTAILLLTSGYNPQALAEQGLTQQEIMKRLPPGFLAKGLVSTLCLLLGFVLGIITLVLGRKSLRWMRDLPGNWKGSRRIWLAIVMGSITVFGPIVLIIILAIRAALKT